MSDSPVQVNVRKGEVQGQAQAQPKDPHDGTHKVYEAYAVTDHVILDANSDQAVQVPEGVGASTVGHYSPLGEALQEGTAEEQFARERSSNEESDSAVEEDRREDQPAEETPARPEETRSAE